MSNITEIFVNWQVLMISFAAFAVLGVIRQIGTKKDENKVAIGGFTQSKWFKMFTPVYPYLLTMGAVFIPGIPLPEKVTATLAVKLMFGIYAGWLSGFSFQVVKKVLENGFNMKFGDDK